MRGYMPLPDNALIAHEVDGTIRIYPLAGNHSLIPTAVLMNGKTVLIKIIAPDVIDIVLSSEIGATVEQKISLDTAPYSLLIIEGRYVVFTQNNAVRVQYDDAIAQAVVAFLER